MFYFVSCIFLQWKKWISILNLSLDDPLTSLDAHCFHSVIIPFFHFSLRFLAAQWLTWGLFPSPSLVKGSSRENYLGCERNGFNSLRKIQLSYCWASALNTQLLCRNCTSPSHCNEINANVSFSSRELWENTWLNLLRGGRQNIRAPVWLSLVATAESEGFRSLPRLEGHSAVLTTHAVTPGSCRMIVICWQKEASRSYGDLTLYHSQVHHISAPEVFQAMFVTLDRTRSKVF